LGRAWGERNRARGVRHRGKGDEGDCKRGEGRDAGILAGFGKELGVARNAKVFKKEQGDQIASAVCP